MLARDGYDADTASDGFAALDSIARHLPELVLLDVDLPGLDGHEVCRRLRADARTRTLPIILLTGSSTVADVVTGLDAGADDFVAKPYDIYELLARIRSALRLRRAMAEMEAAHGVVAALANAVEAKDATTERHCQRLAASAFRLATATGLDGADLKGVVFGALLHDIGKIGIPEAILTKPGPLTEPEWATMREHPAIGEQICRPLVASRLFVPIIRHHHERWDGAGYPDGLRGDAIPFGARIVALVDAFDAMTHDRPYRAARSVADAAEEIVRDRGGQFDPELAGRFLADLEAVGVMGIAEPPLEAVLASAMVAGRS